MAFLTPKFLFLHFLLFAPSFSHLCQNSSQCNGEEKRRLKILVYSVSWGWSHVQFMGKIVDTLAEAGHEVHLLRLMEKDKRYAEMTDTYRAHKIHVIRASAEKMKRMDINNVPSIGPQTAFQGQPQSLWAKNQWLQMNKKLFSSHLHEFNKILFAQCEEIVNNAEWIARLQAEHYDVGIAEIWHVCPFAFFHRLGIRTQFASLATPIYQNAARLWGIPTFSSYVTTMLTPMPNAPVMNFFERFTNFCNDIFEYYLTSDSSIQTEEPIIRKAFGADFPGLRQIAANISLIFVNTNPFFEMPRPISNKIVNIGGLVNMAANPLGEKLSALLNSSGDGAIFVSFGTLANTRNMGRQLKLSLLRAFAAFPRHKFIWKLEMDENDGEERALFASETPNVHPVKWVDQKALLLHPNVRAFITHCGLNSVTEAARAGVPIIGIPLFGDQHYNAIVAKRHGLALGLDVAELNLKGGEKRAIEALEKILYNPEYRRNALVLSRKLALTPFTAKERLVKWVEFGAEFADLTELNLPWEGDLGLLAYYSIDAILTLLAAFGLILFAIYLLAKRIWCKLRRPNGWKKANGVAKLKNN